MEYAMVTAAWEVVLAIGLPVLGVVVAIWRLGRGDVGPGLADLVLAALATVIWLVILTAA